MTADSGRWISFARWCRKVPIGGAGVQLSPWLVGALLAGVAAPAAAVELTPRVSVSTSYSDNVNLENENTDDALITTLSPGFNLVEEGPRVQSTLDLAVDGRHEASNQSEITVDVRLTGTGQVEAIEDLFFVDASASVSKQVLNNTDAESAVGANQTNQTTVQTYQASPFVTNRLGRFATMETRARATQTLIDSDTTSDTTEVEGIVGLDSGPRFNRIQWSLDGNVSEEFRDTATDVSRWEAEGTVMYAINRIVTLIGAGGYQDFDDGTAAAFGAASWDSGVELTPGPNTDIRATYGVDNDDPRLEARLEHRLSERTRFIVSATETLQTSQAQLGNTLTNIAVVSQGWWRIGKLA